MQQPITIFWFRQDLRIADNPGLTAAIQNGKVLAIYILDNNKLPLAWQLGAASKWWLHHSLQQLNKTLANKLNIYCGDPKTIILDLVARTNASAVYWNRCYEPYRIQADTIIKNCLISNGVKCQSFNAALLWEPWEIKKSDGTPYKVFTPFYYNGCLKYNAPRQPIAAPKKLPLLLDPANTISIATLDLLPKIAWDQQIAKTWHIGEAAAQLRLQEFLTEDLPGYTEQRNYPAKLQVSRLSPYLHFGEISPHQIWYTAKNSSIANEYDNDLANFLREIGWREFSYSLLYYFPELATHNWRSSFQQFPWQKSAKLLKIWQQGKTGYPIIDAGMRELWCTGYMHGRVRMLVASFLVKNLLLHWRDGASWFWDCLLDADLANNSASWQWVAGSGADAAPYFRIFNPITQGEKFDPLGTYTKTWVPELQALPIKYLFKPWTAPNNILAAAGIILGKTYPKPIVDLAKSRTLALQAYRDMNAAIKLL